MKAMITLVLLTLPIAVLSKVIVHETDWISSRQMKSAVGKMNLNRLFPCHSEGRVEGASIRYKASFSPFLKDMCYFYTRWGMSDTGYAEYSLKFKDAGFIEYSHSTFQDLSGNTRHQATWILFSADWMNAQNAQLPSTIRERLMDPSHISDVQPGKPLKSSTKCSSIATSTTEPTLCYDDIKESSL